jgi:hypothetical protein
MFGLSLILPNLPSKSMIYKNQLEHTVCNSKLYSYESQFYGDGLRGSRVAGEACQGTADCQIQRYSPQQDQQKQTLWVRIIVGIIWRCRRAGQHRMLVFSSGWIAKNAPRVSLDIDENPLVPLKWEEVIAAVQEEIPFWTA